MKVLVCGECFSSNLGDGVISEALQEVAINSPEVESVDVLDLSGRRGFDIAATEDEGQGGNWRLRVAHRTLFARSYWYAACVNAVGTQWVMGVSRRKGEMLARIAAYDHLIIGGGQLLRDNRLYFPSRIRALVAVAEAVNTPVSFFSVGVGNEWSKFGQRYFDAALSSESVESIFCRDRLSADRLTNRLPHLAEKTKLTVDAALSLRGVKGGGSERSDRVGLCIMDSRPIRWTDRRHPLATPRANERFWQDLCTGLISRGKAVSIFTTGPVSDQSVAEKVWETCRREMRFAGQLELLSRPLRPKELREHIERFGAIVAFRLHANILGFVAGVPSIALAWDDKVKEFMEYSGQYDRYMNVSVGVGVIIQEVERGLRSDIDPDRRAALADRVEEDFEALLGAAKS